MNYEQRLKRLRATLAEVDLDALYVTSLVNIRYLTGFTGSNAQLLVGANGARFLSDGRYRTQAASEVQGADVVIYASTNDLGTHLGKASADLGATRVGYEAQEVRVGRAEFPTHADGAAEIEAYFDGLVPKPTDGLVSDLRRFKDPEEIALMRTAAEMADAGLEFVLQRVEVGRTEKDLSLDLEFYLRTHGAEAVSFELVVAAAERSALPHARATERAIEDGRYLLFDLGCIYRGYCSDLTRTVVVGNADTRHADIYEVVLRANLSGLEELRPSASGRDVDQAARKVISDAGHQEAFVHGTGHGVGLEIHEAPRLNATSEYILGEGDAVTVEPGIYYEGWGGVRIEDLAVITTSGADILSRAHKELIVI